MLRPKFLPYLAALGASISALPAGADAATISPGLQAQLDALHARPIKGAKGVRTEAASTVLTIITFNTGSGLAGVLNLDTPGTGLLAANGIVPLSRFEPLGIIAANLTAAQVTALNADSRVRSLYDNYRLKYSLSQARVLCGVDRLRNDPAFTAANGGVPVNGAGTNAAATGAQPNKPQFSVVVIDSGVDTSGASASNPDLAYDNSSIGMLNNDSPPTGYTIPPTIPTTKVIQNVQVTSVGGPGASSYLENQPENDSVGHGSHCSGIVAGAGTFAATTAAITGYNANTSPSAGAGQMLNFTGVASGARLIGCGSGAALFVLDALGGFNYAINFQTFYNVRITSNSYGSDGPYNPADPLNVAIKSAYDHNITNVFAAGNSGPGVDTIGIQAKSPYVICVAAGTKEGGLASFSSRGKPPVERNANPTLDAFNLPAITAPGTGREFEYNAPPMMGDYATTPGKKFTSDIISTRSKLPGAAAGTNDQELPTPYVGVYTQISGTSMACPFVAGTVALLLDVDSTLTPDSAHPAAGGRKGIKEILQATATHMPDYLDYEVGAGYLNAYAAVDLAFNQSSRGYLPFNRVEAPYSTSYTPFVTNITSMALTPPGGRPIQGAGQPAPGSPYPPATVNNAQNRENFTLDYSPQSVNADSYAGARTKAATGDNAYAFLVDADVNGNPVVNLPPALRTTNLDVRIQFGNDSAAGIAGGNSIGLLLYAPDGTTYSSGIALPVLDSPTRQVVVKSPVPGLWVAELRGIRGLAAVPFTPPTGAGLPDTTLAQIYRTNSMVVNPPQDTVDSPFRDQINTALLNHYMDEVSSGFFQPKVRVTRGDIAQVFADNMPVRQTLTAAPRFTDVSGNLARIAEAITANGSTLRDWDFTPAGLLASKPTQFRPSFFVTRIEVATAFVRSLGIDNEAQQLNPSSLTVVSNGTSYPVVDAGEIPSGSRGYLQMALNRGMLDYTLRNGTVNGTTQTVAYVRPAKEITREELAAGLVNFRTAFRRGN